MRCPGGVHPRGVGALRGAGHVPPIGSPPVGGPQSLSLWHTARAGAPSAEQCLPGAWASPPPSLPDGPPGTSAARSCLPRAATPSRMPGPPHVPTLLVTGATSPQVFDRGGGLLPDLAAECPELRGAAPPGCPGYAAEIGTSCSGGSTAFAPTLTRHRSLGLREGPLLLIGWGSAASAPRTQASLCPQPLRGLVQGSPGQGGGMDLAEGRPGVSHSITWDSESSPSQSLSASCPEAQGFEAVLLIYWVSTTPRSLGSPGVSGAPTHIWGLGATPPPSTVASDTPPGSSRRVSACLF